MGEAMASAMESATMVDMVDMDLATTARGPLRPSPLPRPRLIPTTMEDMAMAMDSAPTMVDMVDMAMDSTTARGLLMPRLLLIPTMEATMAVWAMEAMDSDMVDMVDMVDMATTTARGLLMPRLMLIPTCSMEAMEAMEAMAMDSVATMVDMVDMATTTESRRPKRRLGHKSRSFSESPADMSATNGLFQFEFHPPPVLPVSVLP